MPDAPPAAVRLTRRAALAAGGGAAAALVAEGVAGASHKVAGRGVYLVLSGAGQCEGKPLQKYTSVFLDTGETTTLAATEAMELLHYGLPDLSGMEAAVHTSGVAMQAAE